MCRDRAAWQARPTGVRDKITTIKSAVVVGAGIGGLSAALGLKRRGVRKVVVYERDNALRTSGGSINVQGNAMMALVDLDPVTAQRIAEEVVPARPLGFRVGRDDGVEDLIAETACKGGKNLAGTVEEMVGRARRDLGRCRDPVHGNLGEIVLLKQGGGGPAHLTDRLP